MKKFVAIAFAAVSLMASPAVFVSMSSSALAQAACGPDAPEAWKRPGGYCEQLNGGSLVEQQPDECSYRIDMLGLLDLKYGGSVLVADECFEPVVVPIER